MAGRETANGSASSDTEAFPRARRARIARRVGSARAEKVASSGREEYLTIWLSMSGSTFSVKSKIWVAPVV